MTGPGPHTDDDVLVAEYLYSLISTSKDDLQLDDVLYGNHVLIPHASAALITALGKTRQLAGVSAPGGRTENQLNVSIQMVWSKVGDESTERRNADSRALALERKIHTDTTLGGLIIHGFIHDVTRGEVQLPSGNIGNQ